MATILDVTDLTLQNDEALSISEAVFELVYNSKELNVIHTVMSGIERDKNIPIFGNMPVLGKCLTGCGTTATGKKIPTSQKVWTPKLIGDKLEHCDADLDPLFKVFKRSQKANELNDITGSETASFILASAEQALSEMLWRYIDFGDTEIALTTDSGTLKDSEDFGIENFNCIDGKWKQLFAIATADSTKKVAIAKNGEATYAAQLALGATDALDTMRSMYENADSRMFGQQGLHFEITRSLYNNWIKFREDKGFSHTLNADEAARSGQDNYRGIPIIVRDDWDRSIRQFFDNGTKYNLPHRAVLIANGNQPVGTLDEGSLTEVKSWYNMDDELWKLKFASKIDVKILEDKMVMVAY